MSDRKRLLKRIALGFLLVFVVVAVAGFATVYRLFRRGSHEKTGGAANVSIASTVTDIFRTMSDPEAGFPGQSHTTILCMGVDDNWTDKDEVYTKAARSDTLFILTLDLPTHKATMLSIPRDTYAHIAGTHWNFKINAAYQTGGPERAIATVNELLGVRCDHFMVLNIDATKKMVDALGGVDVNVEHEMHYHDKWGHLNIDLMPGVQHLTGDQAVGFARYRHPDAGAKGSPEDGDERRMYRQHVLFKAMASKAKSFGSFLQVNNLMDTAMSCIDTDLSRSQLIDLAAIYHGVQPDDIQTASLPGDDFRGPKGEWFYRIDPDKARNYVDWLVRGDAAGAHRLTPVVVKNATGVPKLAAIAVAQLKARGYTDVQNGGNSAPNVHMAAYTTAPPVTDILDTGVPDPDAAADVAAELGLTGAHAVRHPNQPNHLGWVAPAVVTVVLGQDYASQAPAMPDVPPADASVDENAASGSRGHSRPVPPDSSAASDYPVPSDSSQATGDEPMYSGQQPGTSVPSGGQQPGASASPGGQQYGAPLSPDGQQPNTPAPPGSVSTP